MEERDLRDWFEEGECVECPRCQERAAVTTPDAGAVVCTSCGFVGVGGARVEEPDTQ